MMSITTVTYELLAAIHAKGMTTENLAPMVGLSVGGFSHRKHGRTDFGITECYEILDILGIPREEICKYFVGGMLPKKDRWGMKK